MTFLDNYDLLEYYDLHDVYDMLDVYNLNEDHLVSSTCVKRLRMTCMKITSIFFRLQQWKFAQKH